MMNACEPAERLKEVQFSPVRKVLEKANQMAAEGRKIIHMEVGEPDFDTPKPIVTAAVDALKIHCIHAESRISGGSGPVG